MQLQVSIEKQKFICLDLWGSLPEDIKKDKIVVNQQPTMLADCFFRKLNVCLIVKVFKVENFENDFRQNNCQFI